MQATTHMTRLEAGRRVFSRVLVGIDGSRQALEAARQAALLEDVDGELTLLSAWDIAHVVGGTGTQIPHYYNEEFQRTSREGALVAANDFVAPYAAAIPKLVRGTPVRELLREIERHEDTLVAVGSRGIGRLRGIVEGVVTTEIVHRAPCSVLVARRAEAEFPRRIVVGVDGSIESAAAYVAARYLSERFGAGLRAVVASGGRGVNQRLAAVITDGERDDCGDPPVPALLAAAESADLLIVGSRGLHGLRALGSVSERVADRAVCSALIVRQPGSAPPRRSGARNERWHAQHPSDLRS
jgi:nucleotide-binding universal stress UspA family protein